MSSAPYSDATLAAFMRDEIGAEWAAVLGWTTSESYALPIARSLDALGVDEVADVTDASALTRLRAVAVREVWRRVVKVSSRFTNMTLPDGTRLDRKSMHDGAKTVFAQAAQDAANVIGGDSGTIRVMTVQRTDPSFEPRRAVGRECARW